MDVLLRAQFTFFPEETPKVTRRTNKTNLTRNPTPACPAADSPKLDMVEVWREEGRDWARLNPAQDDLIRSWQHRIAVIDDCACKLRTLREDRDSVRDCLRANFSMISRSVRDTVGFAVSGHEVSFARAAVDEWKKQQID